MGLLKKTAEHAEPVRPTSSGELEQRDVAIPLVVGHREVPFQATQDLRFETKQVPKLHSGPPSIKRHEMLRNLIHEKFDTHKHRCSEYTVDSEFA